LSGPAEVKYRQLALLQSEGHPVKLCSELLKTSYSGFRGWIKRKPSARQKRDGELKAKILSIFDKSKKNYGSPRIKKSLELQGEKVGKDKVAKLMKEEGLSALKKKAFRPKTTINNPSDKKSPRVFKIEDNKVTKSNDVWASDLTYLQTRNGFCYLVVVIDLYNREIKGWDVSDSMDADNTKRSLLNAVKATPGSLKALTFHSDQGVQYCSKAVRDKLSLLDITQSMSRKGNCYDNAFVESFFHTLKNELEKTCFDNLAEAKKMIFEYINWYNRERLHSSLGYLSPVDYVETTNRLVA
jgi:putative transposase